MGIGAGKPGTGPIVGYNPTLRQLTAKPRAGIRSSELTPTLYVRAGLHVYKEFKIQKIKTSRPEQSPLIQDMGEHQAPLSQ